MNERELLVDEIPFLHCFTKVRLCADSLRKHILVIFAVNEKSYDL